MRNSGRHTGRLSCAIAFLLVASAPAGAQTRTGPGFAERESDETVIRTLLQSANPREQAWGAWYAGRDQLRQFVPLLQQVITQHVSGATLEQRAAVDVSLDALIQMGQPLPPGDLSLVHDQRPAQALILSAFAAKDDEIEPFLFDVLRGNDYDQWFAAANLLLARKSPGVASAIISSLRLTVHVYVTRGNRTAGGVFGSSGGVGIGCGAMGYAKGLPPWAIYRLGTAGQAGLVVHSTGPTTVYYQRVLSSAESTPAGSTINRAAPSADERLQYLARLAGMLHDNLPVRGIEFREITLAVNAPPDDALAGVRADVLAKWSILAHALVQTAALPKDSAATEVPTVDLVVHDPHSGL
jgi:hypothetical protein